MPFLPALTVGTLLTCLAVVAFVMLHNLDRGLEAHMLEDLRPSPRPSLRHQLRELLGVHDILTHLHRLENMMANAAAQLNDLKAQFSDFSSDVSAKLDQLAAAQGDLNPEAQAVFDEIKQAVADADAKVGDADGSDTPEQPEG